MIFNNIVTGIIAIVIGYLLGSIPFAYLFTHLAANKDIRKVSGGNVGARNTFLNVGKIAGIATGFFDIAKGFAAVFIAYRLMNFPSLSKAAAGYLFYPGIWISVVAGHIWPFYLKFKGGNGLAATLGVLLFILPWEMSVAIFITLILWALTHNVVLSFNLSLLSVPVTGLLFTHSWIYVVYPFLLVILMLLHFVPVINAEIRRTNNPNELFDDLFRRRKAG